MMPIVWRIKITVNKTLLILANFAIGDAKPELNTIQKHIYICNFVYYFLIGIIAIPLVVLDSLYKFRTFLNKVITRIKSGSARRSELLYQFFSYC